MGEAARALLHVGNKLILLATMALVGCAGAPAQVRALREFQREQATPASLARHIDEMDAALQLVDELLNKTPYEPGASWVQQLPLDDERLERVRQLQQDAEARASFVRLYTDHLRSVLATVPGAPAAPALPNVALPPSFGSLSEAVAQARPTAPRLPSPSAVPAVPAAVRQLAPAEQMRVVDDALVTTSVAIRLSAEAMALATIIVLESASLAGPRSSAWLTGAPDTAHLAAALPDRAKSIYGRLESTQAGLRRAFEQLSERRIRLQDTAAFQLEEGLVDEIVGVGLHSLHVDLQAGGDALFYTALADDNYSTNRDGSFDYTGRLTKLEYQTEPIVLASAQLKLKLDLPSWAEALGLNLGYATSRVYKSGGSFESGSFASELGIKNRFSDALDAALAVAGVKAAVRIAHFTQGTVRDVLVEDGTELASAPFTFDLKQIDLSYDFAPKRGGLIQSFTLGGRYFDYTLPRILYELVNATPDEQTANYVYSRETPPQRMRTRYYMAALGLRLEKAVTPHLVPYGVLDFAVGYGPTEYFFLRDEDGIDEASNRDFTKSYSVGIGAFGLLGLRWKMLSPGSRLNAFVDLCYHVQSISSVFNRENDEDKVITTGSTDLFHGPTGALGATF